VRDVVAPLAGTDAGRQQLGMGAGGDRTMELDRAAEAVVFEELQAVADRGMQFSVLSEEVGLRSFGAPLPLVVVDPVDGSLNAKQGIPFYNVMMALLEGPAVGDATVGCVVNIVSGERWTAIKGQGVKRNGHPITVMPRERADRIQLLGLESSTHSLGAAARLIERSSKVRILGAMALSMAHTAAGALDAFCAPVPMRLFDMTAAVPAVVAAAASPAPPAGAPPAPPAGAAPPAEPPVIGETGGVATDVRGRSLESLECTLQTRTTLLCAPDAPSHALALRAFAGD